MQADEGPQSKPKRQRRANPKSAVAVEGKADKQADPPKPVRAKGQPKGKASRTAATQSLPASGEVVEKVHVSEVAKDGVMEKVQASEVAKDEVMKKAQASETAKDAATLGSEGGAAGAMGGSDQTGLGPEGLCSDGVVSRPEMSNSTTQVSTTASTQASTTAAMAVTPMAVDGDVYAPDNGNDLDIYMPDGGEEPPASSSGYTTPTNTGQPTHAQIGKHLRELNATPLSSPSRDRTKRPRPNIHSLFSEDEGEGSDKGKG